MLLLLWINLGWVRLAQCLLGLGIETYYCLHVEGWIIEYTARF